jgi:hypothetical protein
MAKTGGLGDNFYIGGYNLSGDIASLDQTSGAMTPFDVTPINASAHVRIGGGRMGSMQFTTFFDVTAGQEHPILSTLPRTDTIATYFRGTTVGNPALSCNGVQLNYDPTRDNTGNLTLQVQVMGDKYGIEWGQMLTAGPRTDTTGTVGAAYDSGQAWANGAQAYLQILSFTGTSVDVAITSATTSGGSYTSVIDFGSQTGIGAFRGAASGAVNEFLKVTTTGTFSNAVFAVMIVLNQTPVTF